MSRTHGWMMIAWASRLAREGNEQAASDLLYQAARYFGSCDADGRTHSNIALSDFASEVGRASCAACGIYQGGHETHLEGCPKTRRTQKKLKKLAMS